MKKIIDSVGVNLNGSILRLTNDLTFMINFYVYFNSSLSLKLATFQKKNQVNLFSTNSLNFN